jgi:sulfite reductase (NADPH) flavoprotein alpha-component
MQFTIVRKTLLNGSGSSKKTMHYEMSFDGTNAEYQTGAAIYLLPKNGAALLNRWLDYLELDEQSSLPSFERTVFETLRCELEIRLPNLRTLELIAKQSTSMQAKLSSGDSIDEMFWGKDLLDLIQEYGLSCESRIKLLESLPRIVPRAYSIASSASQTPTTIALTIASVLYGDNKRGVASDYLADELEEGGVIDGYFVANKHFSIPDNHDAPMIMIGPGTGVAPFRGFLLERQQLGHKGKNWLFFGDRTQANDFLYQSEMLQLKSHGVLHRLDVAFSRDQEHKYYVQSRMAERGAELYEWLQHGAFIFVCGDAKSMAASVEQTIVEILCKHGSMNRLQALAKIEQLEREKRYVKDVY